MLSMRVRVVGDKRSITAGIWAQSPISQRAERVGRVFLSAKQETTSCITTFWNDLDASGKRDHQPRKIVCPPRFVISFSCWPIRVIEISSLLSLMVPVSYCNYSRALWNDPDDPLSERFQVVIVLECCQWRVGVESPPPSIFHWCTTSNRGFGVAVVDGVPPEFGEQPSRWCHLGMVPSHCRSLLKLWAIVRIKYDQITS